MNQKNTTDINEKMQLGMTVGAFTPNEIKRLSRHVLRSANTKSNCDIYFNMLKLNPNLFVQDFS